MDWKRYNTILIDPPWSMTVYGKITTPKSGHFEGRKSLAKVPYRTMTLEQIGNLPINAIANNGAHLWLWTTHNTLHDGFHLIKRWGFQYFVTITWIKHTGFGNYWSKTTQFLLFAYKPPLKMKKRMRPTHFTASAVGQSVKPGASYDLIELVSEEPRIELFARRKRFGWDVWGNEVYSDIDLYEIQKIV